MLVTEVLSVPAAGVSAPLGTFGISWSLYLLSKLGPRRQIKSKSVMRFSGGKMEGLVFMLAVKLTNSVFLTHKLCEIGLDVWVLGDLNPTCPPRNYVLLQS